MNPPAVVAEAARWLGPMSDMDTKSWAGADFDGLRRLYLAAAARGEGVLVGSVYTRP